MKFLTQSRKGAKEKSLNLFSFALNSLQILFLKTERRHE